MCATGGLTDICTPSETCEAVGGGSSDSDDPACTAEQYKEWLEIFEGVDTCAKLMEKMKDAPKLPECETKGIPELPPLDEDNCDDADVKKVLAALEDAASSAAVARFWMA